MWGQIAGFFVANLAAWLLVGWEAGLLQEEWKSGKVSPEISGRS